MELFVQKIIGRKIESQDFNSDDDVLAISDSDSDILETVEKANIVEFLNNNISMLAGFNEELSTYEIFIQPQKLTFGEKVQKGTSVFLICQIKELDR